MDSIPTVSEHTPSAEQARWFTEEVQPHETSLRAYLQRTFPTISDVDDLVQESYIRLLRARAAGPVRSVKAFLFTTARHAAIDIFRRKKVVSIEAVEEIDALSVYREDIGVAEVVSQRQEIQLLSDAIRSLPERTRHVLTLRKLFGLPQKEIAIRLSISEHTVEAHVIKGMRRCRQYLRAKGLP